MLINLTPHNVTVYNQDNVTLHNGYYVFTSYPYPAPSLVIPPSKTIARCTVSSEYDTSIENVPVYRTQYGQVYDLPDPQENVFYIVSYAVASALPQRHDLLIPYNIIRIDGKVVGCTAFSRI